MAVPLPLGHAFKASAYYKFCIHWSPVCRRPLGDHLPQGQLQADPHLPGAALQGPAPTPRGERGSREPSSSPAGGVTTLLRRAVAAPGNEGTTGPSVDVARAHPGSASTSIGSTSHEAAAAFARHESYPGEPGRPASSAAALAVAARLLLRWLEDSYDASDMPLLPSGQPEPPAVMALRGALQQYEAGR